MSSSSSARGAASQRYRALKLYNAAQEFIRALTPPASSSSAAASGRASSGAAASSSSSSPSSGSRAAGGEGGLSEAFGSAVAKFREAYNQQMTSVVYMAGAAMAPALNKAALEDKEAVEKLVVRAIPRPSPRTVLVGDVVAFTSPLSGLGTSGDAAVEMMVRRVAALEGDELVAMGGSGSGGAAEGAGQGSSSASASSSGGGGEAEDVMEVPPGHCWVLADNETLKPSQVCVAACVRARARARVCAHAWPCARALPSPPCLRACMCPQNTHTPGRAHARGAHTRVACGTACCQPAQAWCLAMPAG